MLLAQQADSDTPKALVCIHLCLLSSKMWKGERKGRDFVFWVCVKAGLCSVPTGRSSLPQPPGMWAGQTKPYWHRASPRPERKNKIHIMATTLLPVVAKRGRKEAWPLCVLWWGQRSAAHTRDLPFFPPALSGATLGKRLALVVVYCCPIWFLACPASARLPG